MKYKYPRISNALTYKRNADNTFEVIDHLTDASFTFDRDSLNFAGRLDGNTDPYKISRAFSREEVDDILAFFDEYNLLRYSDVTNISLGTTMKTLWVPKRSNILRIMAYISNALLLISWLPVLVIGIIMFTLNFDNIYWDWSLAGYIAGLIFGLTFHEIGHAFAGISYGARVFEAGVMVSYFIIPGAYVLIDNSRVKNCLKRIQISGAGVETNFLLCGAFLILSVLFPSDGGFFVDAAICNGLLGAFNLTLINGLDGSAIMSEIFGSDNIIKRAKKIIFNKKSRNKLLSQGCEGYAFFVVCLVLYILQISLPVVLISNVFEVIAWFV